MAEDKAGQVIAPKNDTPAPGAEPENKEPARVYSQEDLDRITTKVRRNAARDTELRLRREAPAREAPAPEQKEPPKEDLAPKREDFETYEDFVAATAKHAGRSAAREERKKADDEAQQRTVAEKNQKAEEAWKGKIERAQAKHADFEDLLEENEATLKVIAAAPMRGFITESDIGPEIIRALCLKPEEATRIAALPRYKQAAEIAKIEETLTAVAKPADGEGDPDAKDPDPDTSEDKERNKDGTFKSEKKKEPPPPIEPGTGRPANNSSLPSDKDDPETWRRKELVRMRKAAGK